MRRIRVGLIALAVLLWAANLSALAAPFQSKGQGKAGIQGKAQAAQAKKAEDKEARQSGKPEEKGLEHAAETANPQGVEHGIENAQGKQAEKDAKVAAKKAKKSSKAKHEAVRKNH